MLTRLLGQRTDQTRATLNRWVWMAGLAMLAGSTTAMQTSAESASPDQAGPAVAEQIGAPQAEGDIPESVPAMSVDEILARELQRLALVDLRPPVPAIQSSRW